MPSRATHHTTAIRAAIRDTRLALGLSQRELADRLGIASCNYISMLETGTSTLPISRAPQIASFIGVEPWTVIRAALIEAEGDHLAAFLPKTSGLTVAGSRSLRILGAALADAAATVLRDNVPRSSRAPGSAPTSAPS